MAKVLIKKLDPTVELPAYKTEGASGMDLMALVKEPSKIAIKFYLGILIDSHEKVLSSN